MWQYVNMTSAMNVTIIDTGIVRFNLSAWIGGYEDQDDNARVSLSFFDQTNAMVGGTTTLGPVLAADRNDITSLLFRQANGLVPVHACSARVTVVMTRTYGGFNDGAVDNMVLSFYQ